MYICHLSNPCCPFAYPWSKGKRQRLPNLINSLGPHHERVHGTGQWKNVSRWSPADQVGAGEMSWLECLGISGHDHQLVSVGQLVFGGLLSYLLASTATCLQHQTALQWSASASWNRKGLPIFWVCWRCVLSLRIIPSAKHVAPCNAGHLHERMSVRYFLQVDVAQTMVRCY